jgi:hypothetical protein
VVVVTPTETVALWLNGLAIVNVQLPEPAAVTVNDRPDGGAIEAIPPQFVVVAVKLPG